MNVDFYSDSDADGRQLVFVRAAQSDGDDDEGVGLSSGKGVEVFQLIGGKGEVCRKLKEMNTAHVQVHNI